MEKSLKNLKKQNLYRKLTNCDFAGDTKVIHQKKQLISFASNDYFNLASNNLVKKAAIDAINKYGLGSGSSRYICGNNSLYEKLEKEIAKIKNRQDAIVFSSGYQAAIGAIPALVGNEDLVIADKLIHSSLLDGVKLSGAKLIRFRHNDIIHAQKIIEEFAKKYKKILIITEAIFSMDGDVGKVEELQNLAKKIDAFFLIDCAHGLFDKKIKISKKTILLGTLSKAVGAIGGYVAANKITIDYLRNFAKSAIYTTALPPCVLAASLQSLQIITKNNLAKKLLDNVEYFCDLMNLPKSESAIVIIKIGDNKKVLEIAKKLREKGFLISAIRPPTVEPKGSRLRITFCVKHTKKQIEGLAEALKEYL